MAIISRTPDSVIWDLERYRIAYGVARTDTIGSLKKQGIRRRNLGMNNFHFCLWT
jgi:hypothetical protein